MTGRVASLALPTAGAAVYTVPAGKVGTFNVKAVNTSAFAGLVSIGITSNGGAPSAGEWLEEDCVLSANGGLELTGLVLAAGQKLYVIADFAGDLNVYGFLE